MFLIYRQTKFELLKTVFSYLMSITDLNLIDIIVDSFVCSKLVVILFLRHQVISHDPEFI